MEFAKLASGDVEKSLLGKRPYIQIDVQRFWIDREVAPTRASPLVPGEGTGPQT